MFAIPKIFRTAPKLRFHSKKRRKVARWGPIRRLILRYSRICSRSGGRSHVHSGQSDQRRVIDFYGKEVLPRLRSISRKAA